MNSILAQLRFHSFDFQSRQTPHFREGQIFNGTVLKLMRDDLAMIEISRTPIMAKLEASLHAGHEYWFVVKKNGNTPTLQVLPSLHNPKDGGLNEKSVQHLLRQLGLPPTSTNLTLVSHLQKEGIPFTKPFLQTAASFMQNVSVESGIEVLKIMTDRNLPLNREVFNSIYRFLTAKEPLLTQLQQITTSLQMHAQLSTSVQQLNEQLIKMTKLWTIPLQGGDGESLQLKQLLSMFGLQYEKSVMSHFKQQLPITQIRANTEDIKPILLSLLKEDLPTQMKQLIQDTVHRLTGQQLLMKQDDQMMQLLFQIPLPEQLGNEDAILQFQSKNKDGQIDTDFCRILFYLQLHKLKETVVDVQIQNRIVAVNVYNEKHISNETLKPLIRLLEHQLESKGYQLSSVKWLNETKKQKRSPIFNPYQQVHRYEGVDIKI